MAFFNFPHLHFRLSRAGARETRPITRRCSEHDPILLSSYDGSGNGILLFFMATIIILTSNISHNILIVLKLLFFEFSSIDRFRLGWIGLSAGKTLYLLGAS